ncbi:HupE/UreJ family protein [Pelagibius litoralis]|uniref:HupE/UreJ family protein n=1 Tax=Pelagibius litoralis TaxID=374515 RepID=A0A967F0T1_9PROT|nr:HupE/UreJ family protein [Pelagibius litoralis]NIA70907.1 HupE/UreJ family protein [Pelagibius litoralis]
MGKKFSLAAASGLLSLIASPAWAHHPMGGATPSTFMEGFLSGIGHPIIGVDHLAFIIAVGLAAAFTTQRLLSPLAFVLATVAGCLLIVSGVALPFAEIVITGSVALVGGLVLSGRKVPSAAYLAIFAVAGLFHGWAYGAAIVGAETTPLLAYLAGFGLTQYGIALAAGWVVLKLWQAKGPEAVKPRLAGAVAAGIGAAFLIENIEGMLFAV